MVKDNGGAAFPAPYGQRSENGMTLRDYFAAKCLASVITLDIRSAPGLKPKSGESFDQAMSRVSYGLADAMLAERSKP